MAELKENSIFGLGGLINEIGIAVPKIAGIADAFRNIDDDDRDDVIQGAIPQPTQILPPTQNWMGATKDYVSQVNVPMITVGFGLLIIAGIVWAFGRLAKG